MSKDWLYPVFLLLALSLAGCNGGESGTGNGENKIEPPQKTVVGPITGFGSVVVNGIHFEIENASIYMDGKSANVHDLAVGMVVTVHGGVYENENEGRASEIRVENQLRGIVETNTVATDKQLIANGQSILVDNDTVFKSLIPGIITLEQLAPNMFIEVNGYSSGNGTIFAEYIRAVASDASLQTIEIRGSVKNSTPQQFEIGAQVIAIDSATQVQVDLSNGTIAPGTSVHVKSARGFNGGTILLADEILPAAPPEDSGDVILTAVATSSIVNDRFSLADKTVIVTNTEFVNGSAADIGKGTKLSIQGNLLEDGSIVADRIVLLLPSHVHITAHVDSAGERSINVMGMTIALDRYTQLDADNDAYDFEVEELAGRDAHIKFYYNQQTAQLVATRIEVVSNRDYDVRGGIESVAVNNGFREVKILDLPVLLQAGLASNISTADIGNEISCTGQYDPVLNRFVISTFSIRTPATDTRNIPDDDDGTP